MMRKLVSGSSFLAAVWLAVSVASAQEPAVTATIEPANEHPLLAAPKPLTALRIQTKPRVAGEMPKQISQDLFESIPHTTGSGCWPSDCPYGRYYFLCHDPLYAEDVALERYGCSLPCYAQPAVSAAKYLATVPLFPAKWVIHQIYPCGYCRDCYGQLRPGYLECGCKPWWCETGACNQGCRQ
jgi:hypothetical protein